MVIPAKYQIAHMFNEGVAGVAVRTAKKVRMGYIDHAGAFVVPSNFDLAMPFCAGLAHVETFRLIPPVPGDLLRVHRLRGMRGFINYSDKYVWRDPSDRQWIELASARSSLPIPTGQRDASWTPDCQSSDATQTRREYVLDVARATEFSAGIEVGSYAG